MLELLIKFIWEDRQISHAEKSQRVYIDRDNVCFPPLKCELWLLFKEYSRERECWFNLKIPKFNNGGILGVWDWHVHTAVFKRNNGQGPTVLNRKFCSVLCSNLNRKRIWKLMHIWICIAITFCTAEINTILLITIFQHKFLKRL